MAVRAAVLAVDVFFYLEGLSEADREASINSLFPHDACRSRRKCGQPECCEILFEATYGMNVAKILEICS